MYVLAQLIAIGTGLLVAQVLGMWCKCFLCRSITATVPNSMRLEPRQENGGSRELGPLEILVFFASISLQEYAIAGAWLAFKVAAKWAAWQHITQLPRETPISANTTLNADDAYHQFRERRRFSNYSFGRFISGTLYNIVAAGTGGMIENAISTYLTSRFLFFLSPNTLWVWLVSVWAMNIILTFSLVVWGRPRFCEDSWTPDAS
jgi:hypothetical protein